MQVAEQLRAAEQLAKATKSGKKGVTMSLQQLHTAKGTLASCGWLQCMPYLKPAVVFLSDTAFFLFDIVPAEADTGSYLSDCSVCNMYMCMSFFCQVNLWMKYIAEINS